MNQIYTEDRLDEISESILESAKNTFEIKNRNKSNNFVVLGMTGDLGAGKTTLTKKLLQDLGIKENIISPTFVLRKDYDAQDDIFQKVIHIDAYRLDKKEDVKQILDLDNLDKNVNYLIIVEWIELSDLQVDLHFYLTHISKDSRQIVLQS